MSEIGVEMRNVYKKFKKGEIYDSLRDLIPALIRKKLRGEGGNKLDAREFWAVEDVSFQVKRGEAFGIIGHNGAGKSTILKLLSRIIEPTKGERFVNGRLSALIEVGAGFHQDLTGRENIFLNGTILGMTKDEITRKFDAMVDFSGLEDFIDTPVKRYSSGMYARLGFAVASHVDPDILIVDEVLSVGDWAFQRKCMEKMNSVINSGSTVIFVSHNLQAVSSLCPQSLLLDHGKPVMIGDTEDVIRTYMDQAAREEEVPSDRAGSITSVVLRDENGPRVQFEPGETAWVDVTVKAHRNLKNMSIVISFQDEKLYPVFNTSTDRLGYGTFELNPDGERTFTFELDLHLARGTFHLGADLTRYDVQTTYHRKFPAGTLFIHSDKDVRGAANLYPRLVESAESCAVSNDFSEKSVENHRK